MEKDDGGCQTGIGGTAIGVQFIMVLAIVAWAGTLSGIGFFLLKVTGALRYGTHVEEVGIDSHHHSPPKAYALGPNSLSPSKIYSTMTSESELQQSKQHNIAQSQQAAVSHIYYHISTLLFD